MSKAPSPFRYFHSSPEVIRLVVMMYIRFPLSLRNVEDILFERGIDLSRDNQAVVESLWADVRRGHSPATREPDARLLPLALARR